jgi:transposase
MLADALGRPLRLILTGGQVHDIVTAPELLEGIDGGAVIADKAYDSNHLRQLIANAGMLAVIPSIPSRKVPIPHDANLYKNRNRIERCFNKTLQALRNTLRPKSCPFPSFHPARMRYDLDALNVDSA